MNYFLDAEFSYLPWKKDSRLLSLALVSQDDKEYYACLSDIDTDNVSDFVKQNVIPFLLPRKERKPADKITQEIENFITDNRPTFWAVFPDEKFFDRLEIDKKTAQQYQAKYANYDFQLFKNLWADDQYPVNWPDKCRDLTPLIQKIPENKLPSNKNPHHPLFDAKWARKVWQIYNSK